MVLTLWTTPLPTPTHTPSRITDGKTLEAGSMAPTSHPSPTIASVGLCSKAHLNLEIVFLYMFLKINSRCEWYLNNSRRLLKIIKIWLAKIERRIKNLHLLKESKNLYYKKLKMLVE